MRIAQYSRTGTAFNVWTAALVLAKWLQENSEFLGLLQRGSARVLEIGSGLGVCGLLAARMCLTLKTDEGESTPTCSDMVKCSDNETMCEITLSDLVPEVLDNLEKAIALNGVGHIARVVLLDWALDTGQGGTSSASKWYAGDKTDDTAR